MNNRSFDFKIGGTLEAPTRNLVVTHRSAIRGGHGTIVKYRYSVLSEKYLLVLVLGT